MEHSGDIKRPIQRSIILGSSLFLIALVVLLSIVSYFVLSSSVFQRYDTKLRDVITYVEHNVDADDLDACIQAGTHSQKYDALQSMLNILVDDFELEYLYIVIPSPDVMTNAISATSEAERAAGESDMPLLEETYAYSTEELERYLSYWDSEGISYFRESSEYGEFYTACKPLRNSDGSTIALICADLSIGALQSSLIELFGIILLVVLVLSVLFAIIAHSWISRNITSPLLRLEQSAREYANMSHDVEDVSQVDFVAPDIHTGNEVESLSNAVTKMANDIRTHAYQATSAQMRADNAERDKARLAQEAQSAEKIVELSQSVTSLLTNMPGLSFSKDAETGVYLACNQAFAEYAHKLGPSGVVGLTDYEIFDAETAQHFVDDDKLALSMDRPYVFFEDVFDAAGAPRQFQTTKMKFFDTNGRLCTLGMCVDVTDLMTAQRDTIAARRAYDKAREASNTYYSIARALSVDYLRLYYVDLETDRYVIYRHGETYDDLLIDQQGEGFFDLDRSNVKELIYAPDLESFRETFTKEHILTGIEQRGVFTLSCRVLADGEPRYMNIKASRIEGDENHLILGVSDIDMQMKYEEAAKRVQEERATVARITALSGDYLAIYAVDPETCNYREYSISDELRDVIALRNGDNFFTDVIHKCEEIAYREDFGMIQSLFVKERVISEAKTHGVFLMTFRLVLSEKLVHVSVRAALVEERDGPQLIVGISNIDPQVRREREFAAVKNRANQDALTGVKNKHAYADAEGELNARIAAGENVEFGIVVCDLNDLKLANDTKGHQAGDDLLKQACSTICNVFKHSPVFRIGGDEFAVILQGSDYEHRDELIEEFASINREHSIDNDAVVAWGISISQGDENVAAVFERADSAMYENKRRIKGESR